MCSCSSNVSCDVCGVFFKRLLSFLVHARSCASFVLFCLMLLCVIVQARFSVICGLICQCCCDGLFKPCVVLCPGICFNVVVIVCLRKVACQLWAGLFNCVVFACLGSFSARL